MAAHDIRLTLPKTLVNNTDIEFEVHADKAKLGELHVSKGSIQWVPAGARARSHHVSWEKFAAWMEAQPPS